MYTHPGSIPQFLIEANFGTYFLLNIIKPPRPPNCSSFFLEVYKISGIICLVPLFKFLNCSVDFLFMVELHVSFALLFFERMLASLS